MTPRTGRPLSGTTRKDLRLQLRLNEEEMQLIDDCAKELECTRTETVVKGVELLK